MTIGGWIIFGVFSFCIIFIGAGHAIFDVERRWAKVGLLVLTALLVLGLLTGEMWYFKNTASGQRALVDQKSNLAKGMERTITVYTADGEIIAQYSGRIDIEGNDGFVESVAEID